MERLRTEGWQYMGLTGRYSGHLTQNQIPTHQNQFVYFTHQIEKIKMKQVEEEYYKSDEKTQTPHGPQGTNSSNPALNSHDLYPPSPDKPITSMANQVPEPVKEAVQSLIRAHTVTIPNRQNMVPSDSLENVVVEPTTTTIPTYETAINLQQ
jgi:hypothetical protein